MAPGPAQRDAGGCEREERQPAGLLTDRRAGRERQLVLAHTAKPAAHTSRVSLTRYSKYVTHTHTCICRVACLTLDSPVLHHGLLNGNSLPHPSWVCWIIHKQTNAATGSIEVHPKLIYSVVLWLSKLQQMIEYAVSMCHAHVCVCV